MGERQIWIRGFVVAGLLASCAGAGAQEELRLVLIDLVGVHPSVAEAMRLEAERLLGPSGVTLKLRGAAPSEVRDGSELALVLLPERRRYQGREGSLAEVQTVGANSTIWIDVVAVTSLACARRGLDGRSVEARWAARALGRVLTHELVHYLDPTLRHARRGLMAPKVGRQVLVDDPSPEVPILIARRPISKPDH